MAKFVKICLYKDYEKNNYRTPDKGTKQNFQDTWNG